MAALLLLLTAPCLLAYCQTGTQSALDSSLLVVRGEKQLAICPVCYYYDSLVLHGGFFLGDGSCPEIAYVPAWRKWMAMENQFGDKATFHVADTAFDSPDRNGYDEARRSGEFDVDVNEDILFLETTQEVSWNPYHRTAVKLFFTDQQDPVIGISGYSKYRYMAPSQNFAFYALHENKWACITNDILALPAVKEFFRQPVGRDLAEQFTNIGISADFSVNSDTVNLSAYDLTDADCNGLGDDFERDTPEDKATRKKLCALLKLEKKGGIDYLLDKKAVKFTRCQPPKPISTMQKKTKPKK